MQLVRPVMPWMVRVVMGVRGSRQLAGGRWAAARMRAGSLVKVVRM